MQYRRIDGTTHEVVDGEAVVLDPDASGMTVLSAALHNESWHTNGPPVAGGQGSSWRGGAS